MRCVCVCVAWAIAMVAACAARPAEPLAHVGEKDQPRTPRYRLVASAPRPEIDVSAYLPDLHDEMRWPLGVQTHPMLEPHFPIARELAQPGVGWQDLCTPAVLGRHVVGANASDLMEYLRGWCAALHGDADGALDHLARVRGSVVSGLAAALVYDVPFVLAEQTADQAERLLEKHALNDVAILDVLAATYVEIGRDDDARVINQRAIAFARGRTSDAAYCHRAARDVMLGGKLDALEAEKDASNDQTCIETIHALRCTLLRRCDAYLRDQHVDRRAAAVALVAIEWSSGTNFEHWTSLAALASTAIPQVNADRLGTAALVEAVRTSHCTSDERQTLLTIALRLRLLTKARTFTYEDCRYTQLSLDQ